MRIRRRSSSRISNHTATSWSTCPDEKTTGFRAVAVTLFGGFSDEPHAPRARAMLNDYLHGPAGSSCAAEAATVNLFAPGGVQRALRISSSVRRRFNLGFPGTNQSPMKPEAIEPRKRADAELPQARAIAA